MKSKDLLFIAGILAVLGFLYYLSISGKGVPPIPADATHASVTAEADCLGCHGEGMRHPRKVQHPLKDQCFECHARGEAEK
ncbi:MAG: hypothetical protein HZC51_03800 [Nitrospirae bacterium]|nr:hypothetical protein [Nitrospirota bacterium]